MIHFSSQVCSYIPHLAVSGAPFVKKSNPSIQVSADYASSFMKQRHRDVPERACILLPGLRQKLTKSSVGQWLCDHCETKVDSCSRQLYYRYTCIFWESSLQEFDMYHFWWIADSQSGCSLYSLLDISFAFWQNMCWFLVTMILFVIFMAIPQE